MFYCHYKENEIEQCFKKFEVIYKENRLIKRKIDDKEYTSAYFDYILMKK
ncbi:hypothetical protein [Clostridium sp. FP1]|nr:hypothetical protein [Clostridium sp. FP1]MBZ9634052.1 hypothetical protein [Clostridium sp. FP1]